MVESPGSGNIPQLPLPVIERRGCRYDAVGDSQSEGVRSVICVLPKCKKNFILFHI